MTPRPPTGHPFSEDSAVPFFDCVIVGAGAAGLASATCLLGVPGLSAVVIEAHSQPGGCAGYFVRGQPRRFHDAGATQLIECVGRGIQNRLFRKATGRDLGPLEQIGSLEHVWPGQKDALPELRIVLGADGEIRVQGDSAGRLPAGETAQLKSLTAFLGSCAADAEWMWRLFYAWPRFPIAGLNDLGHALRLGFSLSARQQMRAFAVVGRSVSDEARRFGLKPGSKAWELLTALLLDTSQNSAEGTPYLAGCMGLSILQRGIYRLPRGMCDLFAPWAAGVERSGVPVWYRHGVRSIRSRQEIYRTRPQNRIGSPLNGHVFCVELADSHFAGQHGGAAAPKVRTLLARSVIFAAPVPALLTLVPEDDPLRETVEWSRWHRATRNTEEWQALALYGCLVPDRSLRPLGSDALSEHQERFGLDAAGPWYLQIFPQSSDRIPHALYLSAGPVRHDQRFENGAPHRVFTATAHVRWGDRPSGPGERAAYLTEMVARTERATGCRVLGAELAVPSTFEKYTSRPEGRVGGPPLGFDGFAWRALINAVQHPLGGGALVLAGDWVFPGQGVVAAALSGALAAARVAGKPISELV